MKVICEDFTLSAKCYEVEIEAEGVNFEALVASVDVEDLLNEMGDRDVIAYLEDKGYTVTES